LEADDDDKYPLLSFSLRSDCAVPTNRIGRDRRVLLIDA
jgi:hypothetical protein